MGDDENPCVTYYLDSYDEGRVSLGSSNSHMERFLQKV